MTQLLPLLLGHIQLFHAAGYVAGARREELSAEQGQGEGARQRRRVASAPHTFVYFVHTQCRWMYMCVYYVFNTYICSCFPS